ncbi:MAG: HipA domain-containing protein [Pseudomonadota bacterium]
MSDSLNVHNNGLLAGYLTVEPDGAWQFAYSQSYLSSLHSPVSLAFPKRAAPYRGPRVRSWIANLLPEGNAKTAVAVALGVSVDNDFDLIRHLGGDCFGAVQFDAVALPGQNRRRLSGEDLRNLAAVLRLRPLLADVEGIRYALPGLRAKLALEKSNGEVSLPLWGALSNTIFKPAREEVQESVENEHFCMSLATACLVHETARVDRVDAEIPLLVVARFDRFEAEGGVRARHAESLCAISGTRPERKYEREGGLGWAEIFELVRSWSSLPALDVRHLIDYAAFSFLIGHGTGSAKDVVLRVTEQGLRLAPYFGFWSSHCYSNQNDKLGLSIGHEDRPDWLVGESWLGFARDAGVKPRYVLERVRALAGNVQRRSLLVADEVQSHYGYSSVISEIVGLIAKRARQLEVGLATQNTVTLPALGES